MAHRLVDADTFTNESGNRVTLYMKRKYKVTEGAHKDKVGVYDGWSGPDTIDGVSALLIVNHQDTIEINPMHLVNEDGSRPRFDFESPEPMKSSDFKKALEAADEAATSAVKKNGEEPPLERRWDLSQWPYDPR